MHATDGMIWEGSPMRSPLIERLKQLLAGVGIRMGGATTEANFLEHLEVALTASVGRRLANSKRLGWAAAKSRTGHIKAVGTGTNYGRALYGKAAEEALARHEKAADHKRVELPSEMFAKDTDPATPDAPYWQREYHRSVETLPANTERLLGKHAAQAGREVWLPISMAAPGSGIRLESYPDGRVVCRVHSAGYLAVRNFDIDFQGRKFCENQLFTMNEDSPAKGKGSFLFARQAKALAKHGFAYIKTMAAGNVKHKVFNGYYTWPRLGYDGVLEPKHKRKLPEQFRRAKTVQELFAMPGGREAWKQYGSDIQLTFDLTPGSKSMQILDEYIKSRRQRRGKRKQPEASHGTGT